MLGLECVGGSRQILIPVAVPRASALFHELGGFIERGLGGQAEMFERR